jgi:hypothetical protein
MKHASSAEYLALVIATLILIIVLVSSYMCIQLYNLRKPTPPCDSGGAGADGFTGSAPPAAYTPACGSGRHRAVCRGVTTGAMPAIDTLAVAGNGLCGGRLGVPP